MSVPGNAARDAIAPLIFLTSLLLLGFVPMASLSSPAYGAERSDELDRRTERIRAAASAHKRHVRDMHAIDGVVASGTSLDPDGTPVIRLFLRERNVAQLPRSLDGIRVRTTVSGRIYARRSPTCEISGNRSCSTTEAWPLPVPIGVSVGHPSITAGTIGARVTDGANVYALSNNHVLASSNDAQFGDPALQPGPADGGVVSEDSIGTLADFEQIRFCECQFTFFGRCFGKSCPVNNMDAAIALSTPGELGFSTPTGEFGSPAGYGTPSATLHPAFGNPRVIGDENLFALLGTGVQKMGRTTQLTSGSVDAVNATVNVCYNQSCSLEAMFDDQIIITPGSFSGAGDSGSLIVTNNAQRQPVGLLFAGSTSRTIANRIDLVLNRFAVTIDEGGAVTPLIDAGIANVTAPSAPIAGEPTVVSVVAQNFGNQTIAPDELQVELVDLTEPGAVAGGTQRVSQPLQPGASAVVDFSWSPTLTGSHDLSATLSLPDDENSANDSGSASANVTELSGNGPQLQLRQLTASTSSWTTVDLGIDYGSQMVVACTPSYDLATPGPAMVRVKNATGSSFEVGIARAWFGALAGEHFTIDVHCMVVREGVYTQAEHGLTMEAIRIEGFSTTDNAASWVGESQSYLNPDGYTAPVVLGQSISADDGFAPSNCPCGICDPVWSVFWSRSDSRQNPPTSTLLYVGRHSAEDRTPRPAGTLTYIVLESGTGTMDGRAYTAGLGGNTIRGMDNNPPFSYAITDLANPTTAIVSQSAMNGYNGSWALLYGGNAISSSGLALAVDEDWYLDSERRHTLEQVAYIMFE